MIEIFYIILIYLLICKAWPFFLYPNYFKKSKIENYDSLKKLSFKLKGKSKAETLKNISNYMNKTYSGFNNMFKIKSLFTVFQIGDFKTDKILNKKQFLWCHNQNRLIKSILINTGQFNDHDIKIKRDYLRSFFIHQWLLIKVDEKNIKLDPFYKIFEVQSANS
jgi:hypothetical protein